MSCAEFLQAFLCWFGVSCHNDFPSFLVMFIYILIYSWFGLYPGVGLSPVDEIKKLLSATNIFFLILLAYTFFSQISIIYSRFVLAAAWVLSLILVQLFRWIMRIVGRNLGFWGEPVAIIGNGPMGIQIANYLKNNIRFGLSPYVVISGNSYVLDSSLKCNRDYLKIPQES